MKEFETLKEWNRLVDPKELAGQIESYRLVTDVALNIIFKEEHKEKSAADRDANNLYQMTALKCLSILRLVEDKLYHKNNLSGFSLNVYDPFGLQPIVRAQFEACGHFNNVYLQYNSPEEKQLKHDLWVLCGLLNRQKFDALQPESAVKKAKEAQEIEELKKDIENNSIYQSLESDSQQMVFKMAKRSDWKLTISGNKAIFVGWQELAERAGTNAYMKNMYRHFSLNAHPSNVSVFQFRDAYDKGKEAADFFTQMALKLSKFYMSIFIVDYCKHNPEAMAVFNSMPPLHQLLINSYSRMVRSEQFQANNVWDTYGPIFAQMVTKDQPLQGKVKIRFDHETKTATFSMVSAEDGKTVLYDHNNERLDNMNFPYEHFDINRDLLKLVEDDGKIGIYFFN